MSGAWIAAFAALCVVVVLIGLVLVGTLRRISAVLEQAEARLRDTPLGADPGGLGPGSQLPEFRVARLHGGWVTDEDVRGAPSLFLFLSANCPPCKLLARELRRAGSVPLPLYVVFSSADEAVQARLEGLANVVIQTEGELATAFRTSATPHVFAIDAKGIVVGSGTPNTLSGLSELAQLASLRGVDTDAGSESRLNSPQALKGGGVAGRTNARIN